MRCFRVRRLMDRYIDQRLPGRLTDRVRTHLERCSQCRAVEMHARAVGQPLRPARAHAPEGFASRVMERVNRLPQATNLSRRASNGDRWYYRRLGYSFVATAAILSASLVVPHLAYPNLIAPHVLASQLEGGRPNAVARILNDAGSGFRNMVMPASIDSTRGGGPQ